MLEIYTCCSLTFRVAWQASFPCLFLKVIYLSLVKRLRTDSIMFLASLRCTILVVVEAAALIRPNQKFLQRMAHRPTR